MKKVEVEAKRFLPLTESTFFVLVALAQPRHGYGIMQDVAEMSGGRVQLGPGTLYGALTNLLRQGLIAREGEVANGDERRKVYALTRLGRAVVIQESERVSGLAELARQALARFGGVR